MFDGLEAADRPAELHAVLGVIHRHVKRHLCHADHLGAFGHRGVIECLLDQGPAFIERAHEGVCSDFDMAEFHFTLPVRGNGVQWGLLHRQLCQARARG